MIVNKDENTITFNKNQIFRTKLWSIRNNITKNEFQVNNEVLLYASIQEIQFGENDITLSLLGKDETEFNYVISKEFEEEELPSHLTVDFSANSRLDTYLKLFVLESYNVFLSGETDAPVSNDVNDLLNQITELTNQLNEANEQIELLSSGSTANPSDLLISTDILNKYQIKFSKSSNAIFSGPSGQIAGGGFRLEVVDPSLSLNSDFDTFVNVYMDRYELKELLLNNENMTEYCTYSDFIIYSDSTASEYNYIKATIALTFNGSNYPDAPEGIIPLSLTLIDSYDDNEYTLNTNIDMTNQTFLTD